MKVRVGWTNEFLGHGVFFEGDVTDEPLDNFCADRIARLTARDGKPRKDGMWWSEAIDEGAGSGEEGEA